MTRSYLNNLFVPLLLAAALLLGGGCKRNEGGRATPVTVRVEVVATGLEIPWSLAFAPDGRLFFTERPGRIRVIQDGKLLAKPVAQLSVAGEGEGGLLGIALDPAFAANRLIYIYYTYADKDKNLWNRVVRFREGDDPAGAEVIIDRIPGGRLHNGGRIRFGPDGKLYVTTGDAGDRHSAGNARSLAGKVLRLNRDGSVPADNPTRFPYYTLGHRNPQGLDWDPGTGVVFLSEHGPAGHDEINRLEPGKNYGWPQVIGKGRQAPYVDPVVESGKSTWAPSGMAFYRGDARGDWLQGDLFVATLAGQHLHRFSLAGSPVREQLLFQRSFGRLRDVVVGPDGSLYLATSNRDGRGNPTPDDDRIIRLEPPR